MDILGIMRKYSEGTMEIDEANEALKELKAPYHLKPGRNTITEEEKRATTVGFYPEQVNGFGLLDTGTGSLDKVEIVNGRTRFTVNTVIDGKPNMAAFVLICGRRYEVWGDELRDCE